MSRIQRKQAISVAEALKEMFRQSGLSATFNTRRIFCAWDIASGAGKFTIRRFFRDGVLYVSMKSSVMAGALNMQKTAILEKMNAVLADDPLFIKEKEHTGPVKEIRIR